MGEQWKQEGRLGVGEKGKKREVKTGGRETFEVKTAKKEAAAYMSCLPSSLSQQSSQTQAHISVPLA